MADLLDTIDTEQAAQLVHRYARAVDRRDSIGWIESFTVDGEYSATTFEQSQSSGLLLFVDRGIEALKERAAYLTGMWTTTKYKTLHTVTNVIVDGDDGRDVSVTSYFVLLRTGPDGRSNLHACGEYRDVYRRVDSELKLLKHHVVLDAETLPSDMTDLL